MDLPTSCFCRLFVHAFDINLASTIYIFGAQQAAVHGVAGSRRRLNDFTFTFHFHALEKEMATHSSVLAWRIPGTGEPGGCCLWVRIESNTTEATQQQHIPLLLTLDVFINQQAYGVVKQVWKVSSLISIVTYQK